MFVCRICGKHFNRGTTNLTDDICDICGWSWSWVNLSYSSKSIPNASIKSVGCGVFAMSIKNNINKTSK